ncbi:hypothetical protein [Halomonas sp. PGE1]|uniref:hypothetical protein n=1 Tax=Halomonas sp. PGE1 TaxID=2730360 RepID=UPI001474A50B|nr:hypothetical protein [Halomonas sp. PGE1]QJQ98918.1 hypothetical protein HIR79_09580 [Halomonas sp. PGE1]
MSKEFVTANQAKADKALERIAARVAEMIAPTIGEAVANELKANASSNGRKLNPADLTNPSRHFDGLPKGDEWDTLPDGDDTPAPGGDHYSNLPTD